MNRATPAENGRIADMKYVYILRALNIIDTRLDGSPYVAPAGSEVWRWGESNPRPRSRETNPLHV